MASRFRKGTNNLLSGQEVKKDERIRAVERMIAYTTTDTIGS